MDLGLADGDQFVHEILRFRHLLRLRIALLVRTVGSESDHSLDWKDDLVFSALLTLLLLPTVLVGQPTDEHLHLLPAEHLGPFQLVVMSDAQSSAESFSSSSSSSSEVSSSSSETSTRIPTAVSTVARVLAAT
eukprot:m.378743 g.378743  ORF g.378743 m.378743 type:complete len:133 (+) comp16707_c1_seq6:1363-1761(+)